MARRASSSTTRKKQAVIFSANPQASYVIRQMALQFLALGGIFLVVGIAGLILMIQFRVRPPLPIIAAFAILASLGAAGLLIGVRTLIRSQQPITIEVQEHRLIWQEGMRITTLEYEEVERVEMVRGRRRSAPSSEFPIVRFIEDDGEMLELEVAYEDTGVPPSRHFDVHGITQAVLPYLRGYAEIAPEVDDFVEHGLIDLDALPRR